MAYVPTITTQPSLLQSTTICLLDSGTYQHIWIFEPEHPMVYQHNICTCALCVTTTTISIHMGRHVNLARARDALHLPNTVPDMYGIWLYNAYILHETRSCLVYTTWYIGSIEYMCNGSLPEEEIWLPSRAMEQHPDCYAFYIYPVCAI